MKILSAFSFLHSKGHIALGICLTVLILPCLNSLERAKMKLL